MTMTFILVPSVAFIMDRILMDHGTEGQLMLVIRPYQLNFLLQWTDRLKFFTSWFENEKGG